MSKADLDAAIAEFKETEKESGVASPLPTPLFAVVAVAVAAIPLYPFLFLKNSFDLTLDESTGGVFAVVTLLAAFCLFHVYTHAAQKRVSKLDRLHPEATTNSLEATANALFFVNSCFLGLLFCLMFWLLPDIVPDIAKYVVAVSGPSVLLFANAKGFINL